MVILQNDDYEKENGYYLQQYGLQNDDYEKKSEDFDEPSGPVHPVS